MKISEIDALTIMLLSASDFKFRSLLFKAAFPKLHLLRYSGSIMLKMFQELKYSVYKETWETLYTV